MEKRKIESAAELVSACENDIQTEPSILILQVTLHDYYTGTDFYYAEPVEVVELWFDELQRGAMVAEVKVQEWSTHKQTQIIQNGEIIWTKTEKI